MNISGAPAAFRGYRVQALYIIQRALSSLDSVDSLVFQPEGKEDLDVLDSSGVNALVQVKSYANLVLSDLSPEKENSFFRRVLNDWLGKNDVPSIQLVNFGAFGKEMRLAWEGDEASRSSIENKLLEKGFDGNEIEFIFSHVQLVPVDESKTTQEVFDFLANLITGVDPQFSLDLLQFWIYLQSEKRTKFSYSDIIEKIHSAGKFLADRLHYHNEWFTSIQPIEEVKLEKGEIERFTSQYFQGISAEYLHIQLGLDFRRGDKLDLITRSFERSNIVIIHAASGQGKSSLAYRYIHDNFPQSMRFSIKLVENRQHALRIGKALNGYAASLQVPMLIYFDVSARDVDWPELVLQLSGNKFLRILITIREEDLKRTNFRSIQNPEKISLEFNYGEAKKIYQRAMEAGFEEVYLNFEASWDAFGRKGPLMEYVYFLTQTEALQERLSEQIKRIQIEVREKKLDPGELHLLRLTSVATALEARVKVKPLIEKLNLPEPSTTLSFFEDEYLLRLSPDKKYLIGLHPIRSKILADLLTDEAISPWIEAAKQVIHLIPEADYEIFILRAFASIDKDIYDFLNLVFDLRPTSWRGLAGVINSLLWIGVKDYVFENRTAVEEARDIFGQAWYFLVDLNFAGDEALDIEGWWNNLGDLITPERRKRIEGLRQDQTPKETAFQFAERWFASIKSAPKITNSNDWTHISTLMYWAYRFELTSIIDQWDVEKNLPYDLEPISLSELGELSLTLFLTNPNVHQGWLKRVKPQLESRLATEFRVLCLEIENEVLKIHFLTYPDDQDETEYGVIHDLTLRGIEIVRYLFPQFNEYGAQGYGHQLPEIVNTDDSSKKGIPREHFPPKWAIRVNSIATGLIRLWYRTKTWDEYLEIVFELRKTVVNLLEPLIDGVSRYIMRDKPHNILKIDPIEEGKWDAFRGHVSELPSLPLAAADPLGFEQPEASSSRNRSPFIQDYSDQNRQSAQLKPSLSFISQIYKPYLDSMNKYFTYVSNFMEAAVNVGATNFHIGKLPENSPQWETMKALLKSKNIDPNTNFRSYYLLQETIKHLSEFQMQFRDLFLHRVNSKDLVEIEDRENTLFELLPALWYFYAIFPRKTFPKPKTVVLKRTNRILEDIQNEVANALQDLEDDETKLQVFSNEYLWNNASAIWVQLDVIEMAHIHQNIEELILRLREVIGEFSIGDVEYYLVEKELKYIVIFPTVKGSSVDGLVWPIQMAIAIGTKKPLEEIQFAFVPQQISEEQILSMGFSLWKLKKADVASMIHGAMAAIFLMVSMLSKLIELPELTDAGKSMFDRFMEDRYGELSELLEKFLVSAGELLKDCESIPEPDKQLRSSLIDACEMLEKLKLEVMPSGDLDKIQDLSIQNFSGYAERLGQLLPYLERVKMLWLDDEIKQIT